MHPGTSRLHKNMNISFCYFQLCDIIFNFTPMMEKIFQQERYIIVTYLNERDNISPFSHLFGIPDTNLCTKYLGSLRLFFFFFFNFSGTF